MSPLPLVPVPDPDIQFNFDRIALAVGQQQQYAPWVAPTLTGTWVNQGGGASPAGYHRDALGYVHLRGRVKNGADGTSAFTLPAGFRPAYDEFFTILCQGGVLGYLTAKTDGTVLLNGPNHNDTVIQAIFRAEL